MSSAKPAVGLLRLLIKLLNHFSRRRRFQFCLLIGLMLVGAFTEIVSLGMVLPFLGILIEPDKVFDHSTFSGLWLRLGIESSDQLILPLTIAFASTVLLVGAFRCLLLWVSTRLALACGVELGNKVYRHTLYQPYSVHVARNSSEVISGVTSKVDSITFGVVQPLLIMISSLILVVTIVLTLIILDPLIALVITVSFGGSYGLITWIARREVNKNSERIALEQTQVVKALQEGLGGIRDILLNGSQQAYCKLYNKANFPLRRAQAGNLAIASCPRFALEAIGVALIATLAYFLSTSESVTSALPKLGMLVFGAQRLLPALQYSYSSWTSVAGGRRTIVDILDFLNQPLLMEKQQANLAVELLSFEDSIQLNDVRFRYSNEGPWVLDGLNLKIPKGARIGFVGSTGSGKSTMLDLLMGLLTPTEGQLLVDDIPIIENMAGAWQKNITHVPQNICLHDSTVAENIAFGVSAEVIDFDRVRQVARQARIDDFLESQPEGYNAQVGERGISLSGGQCQRIGIARALYKKASVLVFDEATSALDNATERAVMDTIIDGLSCDFTILIIAHRLSTVQRCDSIVELDQGKVAMQGTYDELLKSSPSFRQLVNPGIT